MNNDPNFTNPTTNPGGEPGVIPAAPVPTIPSSESAVGPAKKNTLAIVALVLGILAILNGVIIIGIAFGIAAIIFAILSKRKPGGKGLALGGAIMGSAGILIGIVTSVLAGMLFSGTGLFTTPVLTEQSWEKEAKIAAENGKALMASKKDFAKGETAKFGNYEVKVNSVVDGFTVAKQPVRSDYDNAFSYADAVSKVNPSTGKRFVVLDVTVKNVDSIKYDDIVPDMPTLKLFAGGQAEYPTTLKLREALSTTSLPGKLDVGQTATGKVLYEIKTGVAIERLQYTLQSNTETGESTELRWTLAL